MPEGPELHLASKFVNEVCEGRFFGGHVQKSAVSKSCNVDFSSPCYSITSQSRGKELALTLSCQKDARNQLRLLFRFGMSGRFAFGPVSELHKHAHLNFFATTCSTTTPAKCDSEGAAFVLSFVDARRFGSWHVTEDWGKDRGPDPMFEYEAFRSNVLDNLDDVAFNRPICEAMLNQKYFNGIGNYLRAEVLYRCRIPPFARARDVLATLKTAGSCGASSTDMLQLCHSAPLEVIQLGKYISKYGTAEDMKDSPFIRWLQCYVNPQMRNMVDHNGRTIWFSGEAGPLAPKGEKTRHTGSKLKAKKPKSVVVKKEIEAVGGVTPELLNDVTVEDTVEHMDSKIHLKKLLPPHQKRRPLPGKLSEASKQAKKEIPEDGVVRRRSERLLALKQRDLLADPQCGHTLDQQWKRRGRRKGKNSSKH